MVSPKASSRAVQNVMRANRATDTGPELRFRSIIHRAGLRYAINTRPEKTVNRSADLVFRSAKVAVLIHGCFWHGCSRHYTMPKRNRRFWAEKMRRNRERDKETRQIFRKYGWKVFVFWEHENFDDAGQRVVKEVRKRRKILSR